MTDLKVLDPILYSFNYLPDNCGMKLEYIAAEETVRQEPRYTTGEKLGEFFSPRQ